MAPLPATDSSYSFPTDFHNLRRMLEQTINSRRSFRLEELKKDFREDFYNHAVEKVAESFGFPSFVSMLESDELADIVEISVDEFTGEAIYSGQPNGLFSHIQDEMRVSMGVKLDRDRRDEREKHARALLPQNRGSLLEGRRILARLVYELGGEKADVRWDKVQGRYLQQHRRPLDKQELRQYFQRDKLTKILATLCATELEMPVRPEQNNGLVLLRLRRPYAQVCADFDATIQSQMHDTESASFSAGRQREEQYGVVAEDMSEGEAAWDSSPPSPCPIQLDEESELEDEIWGEEAALSADEWPAEEWESEEFDLDKPWEFVSLDGVPHDTSSDDSTPPATAVNRRDGAEEWLCGAIAAPDHWPADGWDPWEFDLDQPWEAMSLGG